MSRLPVSTFVAYLTDAGRSEIIFADLRPEMPASNVVRADVPHQSTWHAAVGTGVHKRRRGQWRLQGFPASAARRGLLQFLNLALAGLMDGPRVKFDLHFEVIVVAAEEPKKSEEHDEPEMHRVAATQQQPSERWRCLEQREKLDVRKAEQDNFRVVRGTVGDLLKCTHWQYHHIFWNSMSSVVWLFALLFKEKDDHGGCCTSDRSLFLAAWLSRRCSLFVCTFT